METHRRQAAGRHHPLARIAPLVAALMAGLHRRPRALMTEPATASSGSTSPGEFPETGATQCYPFPTSRSPGGSPFESRL